MYIGTCQQVEGIVSYQNICQLLPYIIKIRNVKKYAKITPTAKYGAITSTYVHLRRSTMAHQNP